jgi:putative peptidoglycan lipid II flippase
MVAVLNFLLLYALMRRRIGGIEGRKTATAVAKILFASALMAVVCWALSRSLGSWLPANLAGRSLQVAVSVGAGAIAFYFASRILGVRELRMALNAIGGRFFRPLRP